MPKSKVYQLSDNDFIKIIMESFSYAECARKIGLSAKSGNTISRIKDRCISLNLNTNHFNSHKAANETCRYDLKDILVENSKYENISRLKERLINEKYLEYKCVICGNEGVWNNQKLTLQLDHINGKHLDHRIENLRFLCPNCHSQTETFSGRNKK